jgi:hypothetical protein
MSKICFISGQNIDKASSRLRIIKPAQFLAAAGVDVSFNPGTSHDDINVISKIRGNDFARLTKGKVIWDVCEPFFDPTGMDRDRAIEISRQVDAITTINIHLKNYIEEHLRELNIDIPVFVVEDPYWYPARKPTFLSNSTQLNLVWYGNSGNMRYGRWYEEVFEPLDRRRNEVYDALGHEVDINLTFMTDFSMKHGSLPIGYNKVKNINITGTNWTRDAQEQLVARSDISIFTMRTDEFVRYKSNNKLLDSIMCGTPVISSPQLSYKSFGDNGYAFIGKNFPDMIIDACRHPIRTLDMVKKGQAYIESNYCGAVIARQWKRVIESL